MNQQSRLEIYTAKQEYEAKFKDNLGRFPRYLSKNGDVFQPVLSEWLVEQGFRADFPDGKKFAVCLSHDIDLLYNRSTPTVNFFHSANQFRKGKIGTAAYHFQSIFKKQRNPVWQLEHLNKIENEFGARSTNYFLSLQPGERDFNYHLSEIRDLFQLTKSQKGEIGLHGGHEAWRSFEKIQQEKQQLEAACSEQMLGYRNHFLRFNTPTTWQFLAQAGFRYDTTFGFADCAGFRNGLCHPFFPKLATTGERLPILELPLHIMDATFENYMRLNWQTARTVIFDIINKVSSLGGVVSILWHNHLATGEAGRVYRDILEHCARQDAWFPTSLELADFWLEKKYGEQIFDLISRD